MNQKTKDKIITKLIVYPLALTVGLGSYVLSENQSSKIPSTKVITEATEEFWKEFEPGKHVISIPIKNTLREEKIVEYPYHEGYQCIGFDADIEGGCLLYINTETVWCKSTGKNNRKKYVFTDFGEVESNNIIIENNNDTKIYEVGEHIISLPITNPLNTNQQYEYHEGYEIIDIAFYTDGKYQEYKGGAIIYRNTEKVECKKEFGKYQSFGKPIEKTNVKKKDY